MSLFGKLAGALTGGRNDSPEEQLLKSTGLFSKLGADELKAACQKLTPVSHREGDSIFAEGALGDAFYVIRSGVVRIGTHDEDGKEIVLARLEAGQYFGEQALLDETPSRRSASATAFADTDLLRLSHADFRRVLESSRKLEQALREHGSKQFVEKWTKQRSVFRAIDGKLLESLWRNVREFEPGAVIVSQGDTADGVYFITDGEVRIVIAAEGAEPREALLSSGQMFGELGTLREAKRAGSAIAETQVRTLFFDKKQFRKLYESSPELERWVQDVQSIYEIPHRGVVSIHDGEYLGMDCVTSVFQLKDGRSVTASKVRGQEIFVLAEAGAPEGRVLRWEKEGLSREVSLVDGRIAAIVSNGHWPELGRVCAMAFDAMPVEEWRESLFRSNGLLEVVEPQENTDPTALVCNCMRVTRGRIREAITGGCAQLETVSTATGAGTVCGGCRPKISAMLGNTSWEPVRIAEVIERCPDIRSYRFKLYSGAVAPYEPGQHLVIQSLIDERFISRSYTLTSEPSSDCYEITVKREPQGYFSNWLFEHAGRDPFLRVATPGGSGIHTLVGQGPIVCLVAGIGVTPAIALARHLAEAAEEQRLHIDYSASTREEMVFADELRAVVERKPNVSLNLRVTSESGRLGAADIAQLVAAHAGAGFFICGSQPYRAAVTAALLGAGVPPERVLSEEFSHAGAPQ